MKGVCSVYAQILFYLSAERVRAVYESVAVSLLRGHLFNTDLKVTQPLVHLCKILVNNSSMICN